MLEWHQKMITFEQSTPDSITSPFDPTKTMLASFESLGDAMRSRFFECHHFLMPF